MATTLFVTTTLDAPPSEVFRALTDAGVHGAFTGSRSDIDAVPGGAFSYLDGAISGTFVALEPPSRLHQRLRAADWPDGHEADVRTELVPARGGAATLVRVLETGAPETALDRITEGWSNYWSALSRHFVQRKKDVVHRFVEEYKNRHNTDIVDDLVAEDCRVHIPLPGLPQGREGMRVNGRMVCGAFPDVCVEGEFFVCEGDMVIERASARATHLGDLMGIEPTGNSVTWTELHAYRVEDGRITEVWTEADFMGIMVQIGAVPQATSRLTLPEGDGTP